MVLLPLAPSTTFRAGVEFESEKDDGEAMLSAMATVVAKLPDVPLTITVAVPAVAAALAGEDAVAPVERLGRLACRADGEDVIVLVLVIARLVGA